MKIGINEIKNFGKPYIIAEIGANHNGNMDLAIKMIDAAKEIGCDCVKFQSWTKDSIFSKKVYEENCFLNDDYRKRKDYTLEEIVEAYSTSQEHLMKYKEYCDEIKIDFGCTPFSKAEVDFLVDKIQIPFIKIASMDLNNYPFLEYIARKNKPIVLSTGLSTLSEIDAAVEVIENSGNKNISILHCESVYPPRDETINMLNIDMFRSIYTEYPIGYSDHSLGVAVPLAAVARGACIIEKHFTLDKNMPGWDHKISADVPEMREIVLGCHKVYKALGSYRRVLSNEELEKIPAFRRSIVAARPISKGKQIELADLNLKRPGTGIEPKYLDFIVGKIASRDILFDEILQKEDF